MFSPRGLTPTSPPGGTASLPAQHAQGRKTGGLFSPDPNVHLFDRLAIIVKHWKAAIGVAMLVIAGTMYQTYTTVPLYRAQARIQIDEEHTAAVSALASYRDRGQRSGLSLIPSPKQRAADSIPRMSPAH